MRRTATRTSVPERARPSASRAAAAARLAGAPASRDDVSERMRRAARRSAATAAKTSFVRPAPAPPEARPPLSPPEESRPADRRPPVPRQPPAAQSTAGSAALALAPQKRTEPKERETHPRHLRVVLDPGLTAAQRRRRARAALIVSIAGATLIGLTLVYLHVVLAQRQFAIDHLNTQISQAQTTYQARRLQVAQLSAPAHIISEAEGQLGMVQPANVDYLTPAAGTTAAPATQAQPLGQRSTPATVPASGAPAGEANWPVVKSDLAGQP